MKRTAFISFFVIEAILYGTFLLLDLLTDINTKWFKFAAILLIALFSFRSESKMLRAAFCFTAAADIFLLLLNRWYGIGLLLFLAVQLLYSRYLHSKRILIVQAFLAASAVSLWILYGKIEILAAGYIIVFSLNLIHAGYCVYQEQTRKQFLFFLGLLLFFCCDLCVGYYNIGSGALWPFTRIAMWGFYLPGQILILMSSMTPQGDLT